MGAGDPAGEAFEVSTELAAAPLARVCRVLEAPRSTAHYRRRHLRLVTHGQVGPRPGPAGMVGDDELIAVIRQVIGESPFDGEGYTTSSGCCPTAVGQGRVQGDREGRLLSPACRRAAW